MSSRWILALASLCLIAGCRPKAEPLGAEEPAAEERGDEATGEGPAPVDDRGQRAQASRRPAAGSTCSGRDDCTSDQICVEHRCQYRITSVAAEVLAAAAEAQAEAGDWEGAIDTYQISFDRFREQDAPVPPDIACGAAELILRTARDAEARERGARTADHCFRSTVPGYPGRVAVRRALARLRYEGLDITTFDGDEPAERFFTGEQSRPTVDAVQVSVQMPDLEGREMTSHTAIRERLASEEGQRAIAECFISDWDERHDRSASAELVIRYATRLRDMGSYDVYEPELEVSQTTTAESGFEPCLAGAIPALFEEERRSGRGEAWNQAVQISARIQ